MRKASSTIYDICEPCQVRMAARSKEGRMKLLSTVAGTAAMALATTFAAPGFAQDASTFVYADAGEPSTIDPAKANVNWELTVTRNVYDRLVDFDLDDPSKLLPALATEWKQ